MKSSVRGYTLLEIVIAIGIAAILGTTAMVAYVNYQSSSETVDGLATLSILEERLAVVQSLGGENLVTCDDSLVRPGDLANDYMNMSITALLLDESDASKGFGGGVVVSSTVDKVGPSGIVATRSLHDELVGQGADVRGAVITESAVSFSVLITPKYKPYCNVSSVASLAPASSVAPTSGTATISPPADPIVSLEVSAEQEVLNTGADGRAVVQQLNTGGDMNAMTLEFSVVGKEGGSKTASTGPVIFNYGTATNNNLVSAWRPSNFTIALQGRDYPTGIDLTDGQSHRVTIGWDAASGELRVFDNGVFQKAFTGVSKDTAIPGNGHLVLAQKMNNPGSQSGWNAGEHYSGQIFGTTFATSTFTDEQIAGAPLYTNKGQLVADLRSQGGNMVDVTGNHNVEMQGNPSVTNVHVNTDLALIPPGATVKVTPRAKPGDARSKITNLSLQGLTGLTISDGSGNSGTGSVNITGWDLDSLTITLPVGYSSNISLHLIVVAITDSGTALLADDRANLRMATTP